MNTKNFTSRTLLFTTFFLISIPIIGQSSNKSNKLDRIHVGIEGGFHFNSGHYSDLNERIFPDPKSGKNGNFGIFAEFELGTTRHFSIRPELMFLSRSLSIEDIPYVQNTGTGDLIYSLRAKYTDLRIPILYNFGNPNSIRPYIYVAPILGFVRGGEITAEDNISKYDIDVSKANMASTYVSGAIGAGMKIPLSIGQNKKMHLGVELNYEHGFTDTYSNKEKKGESMAYLFFPTYDIQGSRKFTGFEIKASLSVPLSIFKRSSEPQQTVIVKEKIIDSTKPAIAIEEKPCYTLEEILNFLSLGQSIKGKTICAIDLINFDFNKATLTSESCEYLDKIANLMIRTSIKMEIKGHTDNIGPEEINMEISRKRAKAVYDYLISKGVNQSSLSYFYYGMSKPIVSNNTPEGRKQNRRVEFEILN